MEYFHQNTLLYLDGKYLKATEAKIDLYSQSMHYGYAVFEGIRSYKTIQGKTKIFKAREHFERLIRSASALNIPFSVGVEELTEATYRVLAENDLQDAYIRPLVFMPADMTFAVGSNSHLAIEAWPMQPFLGEKLLRVMNSTFQRPNPKGFKIEAKATGHYVNSILASQEAKASGYDEALLTDMEGYVAEGPGANVFFEKGGKIFTPAKGNILPGITRATVIEICAALDIPLEEKRVTVAELVDADSAFSCGTAAEVIGWESLDGVPFKKPWNDSLGKLIREAYKNLVVENWTIDGVQKQMEPKKQKKEVEVLE
jgi:branched-chain amino acid aminotransferase